jgi:kynurenine formamidase
MQLSRLLTILVLAAVVLPHAASAQDVRPMARAEFDALLATVNNAGRWGNQDERGTLNLITADVRRAAALEVQTGITVSLAREMVHGEPEGHGFGPIAVDLIVVSDSVLGPSDGSVVWAAEQTSLFYHGWSYTHIDALTHMAYHGRGYNNAPSAHAPPAGQTRNSVAAMRDGILARGVLIDLPALKDVPYVAPGGAITADDFEAWEERTGVRVRPGDILLVRSGRWSEAASAANVAGSAGIHPSAAAWLHERGVAALGDEGGTDTTPTAVEGINSPLHVLVLVGMGMPLIENLDLDRLASEAAAQNRWTFLLVIAPLNVRGATGSAVNPIAIF